MTPTYLQSANAPSLGDICRAGTIVIALGGIVVGPKIEFLHQSPTSASELAVGAPHEDVEGDSVAWPAEPTKELTATSTTSTAGFSEPFFKAP